MAVPDKVYQVIIVGAGIGGLTLAAICKQLDVDYIVLERLEEVKPAGAAISLAPQGCSVLDKLDLYQQIRAVGQPLTRIKVSHNDTEWNELDWSSCETMYGYPVLTVERAKLVKILFDAANGGASVQLNSTVRSVSDNEEDSFVSVELEDGSVVRGQMVVGADGIRSLTRRTLAAKSGRTEAGNTIKFTGRAHMSGWTYPLKYLGKSELGVANWLFYDDAALMTYSGIDNRQWFIAIRPSDEIPDKNRSVWVGVTPEMIKEVHGGRQHPFAWNTGKLNDIVDKAERVLATNIFAEYEYPPMAIDRIALLGDAAHSMSPSFGQGGSAAVEDAAELGSVIYEAFVSSELTIVDALQKYRVSREIRTQAIARFSANFGRVFSAQLPYGLGPVIRKLIFTYAPAGAWLWWLKWLYGYQPVIKGLMVRE